MAFLEKTEVSVGRGTKVQFQIYGHPDFNSDFSFTPMPNFGSQHPKLKGILSFGEDGVRSILEGVGFDMEATPKVIGKEPFLGSESVGKIFDKKSFNIRTDSKIDIVKRLIIARLKFQGDTITPTLNHSYLIDLNNFSALKIITGNFGKILTLFTST